MKKKIAAFFSALVLVLSFSAPELLAKDHAGKESLVALGDSIPYGYNLENHNQRPSKEAFPSLIGEEADLRVRNLSEPGWTTTELLNALQHDEKFRQAVRHVDYVTLSIGNNDLLRAFQTETAQTTIAQFQAGNATLAQVHESLGIPTLLDNLDQIIAEVTALSDAQIIFYNIYNPFSTTNPFHIVADLLLNDLYGMAGINTLITNEVSSENVTVVNAFSALQDNDSYLIDGDIHPTTAGQEVLAAIGSQALQ